MNINIYCRDDISGWISLFMAQWVVENLFEATTEFSLIIDLIGGSYFIYLLVKRRSAN